PATGGRFILGIGGGPTGDAYRERVGAAGPSPVALMRQHVNALRDRLPGTPIYLAALGPAMLRLAGAVADGAALNWCTAEHVRWSRERVAEGAVGAGREPADVPVVEYIRVAVDDDVALARRALAKAVLGYALGRPSAGRPSGYRVHFTRMGFDDVLRDLESRRAEGATADVLVDEFPAPPLERLGYAGRSAGAREAVARLGAGLDLAIARVVAARPGTGGARTVIDACAPSEGAD
ncbi:MAG: LLM class flavin-dependent oxidoreductase, partial [Chloroflexota bacterium]|nr:LLM class flavin-dependent oxidoreductase [Chloroflexota bacterium]